MPQDKILGEQLNIVSVATNIATDPAAAAALSVGIDHANILNIGNNTHAELDSHVANTSLHFSTMTGLSDVTAPSPTDGDVLIWETDEWIPATRLANLIEDTTPQLGAGLDVNGYSITSVTGGDIVIVADTTGLVKIDQDLALLEQPGDETPSATYSKLYAKVPGAGGSGLFFANLTESDEFVSKKKAIAYSIIF